MEGSAPAAETPSLPPGSPKTLPEWRTYVAGLEGAELREVAAGANTMRFVRVLQDEGYGPEAIHAVVWLFARRFAETGDRPPTDGLYDLIAMAGEPSPIDEERWAS